MAIIFPIYSSSSATAAWLKLIDSNLVFSIYTSQTTIIFGQTQELVMCDIHTKTL